MNNRERIERYVRRYFERNEQWPTVRQVAKALRLAQAEIEREDYAPIMLTSYFVDPPDPLGRHFVEICD